MPKREFADSGGERWVARVISKGRSSEYLNERVQRPIVQFDHVAGKGPARYAMLGRGFPASLAEAGDDDLRRLLERSRTH